MPEILFGLVIVVLILVFALIGFVSFLSWIFGSKDRTQPQPTSSRPAATQPTLAADVLATRRLIDHLRSQNQISEKAYRQLRGFLHDKFPEPTLGPAPRPINQPPHRTSDVPEIASSSPVPDSLISGLTSAGTASQTGQPNNPPEADELHRPRVPATSPVIPESPIQPSRPLTPVPLVEREVVQAELAQSARRRAATAESVKAKSSSPAPWDIPDPPPPIPRRSVGELMSGFMQEKNMRWGELTSGILIVLSAVGLVISLREELRNTIPYFSSLLFLLMTAAIHGAGIYTLKKWKLRNTSRGTLIIGLLLVPLNFVAACVLSDRRELDDPWLWVAIAIGIAGFSTLTWWSSKCLLRRGNLPMTLSIMGCGIGTLILNRSVEAASSSFHYLLFALPVAGSFLVGSCFFDTRQWVRARWSHRAKSRMFLFLGVSVFATVAALSLALIRVDTRFAALVALAPIVSVVCIVTSWLGSIAYRASLGQPLQPRVSDQDPTQLDQKTQGTRLSSLTLKVLGLILLALSLLVSASNPTVFVVNAMISTVGLIAMFVHQKDEHLVPIAWGVFAWGALIALNVGIGTFGFDRSIRLEELKAALINGKSALCLLLVGVVVGGANMVLKNWIPDLKDPRNFLLRGWITGGGIVLVGCVIALVASLINRENVFDVMVASGLLMLAAISMLGVCVIADRNQIARARVLPPIASILLLAALAHMTIWNPSVAAWIDSATGKINATWVAMLAVHAMILIGLGWFLSRQDIGETHGTVGRMMIRWGSGSAAIFSIGALCLVPCQTGWATGFELIACGGWFLAGWVWSREESELKSVSSAPFIFITALAVGVGIAELVSRTGWCPTLESPQHWLIQLVGLSAWSVLWTCLFNVFGRSPQWNWLKSHTANIDQYVLFSLVFSIGVIVLDSLFAGTVRELAKSSNLESQFGLGDASGWVIAALASVAVAMLVSLFSTPSAYKGAAIVGIWFLAWAFGATPFRDSNSSASALRWLLPIGGLIGAVLITNRRSMLPVWAAMRNALGMTGKSYWSKSATQQLINFSLSIVSGIVLLISTVTVSQFLLNGAGALGGPDAGSWFSRVPVEISYGVPVALIVITFLLYAIAEKRSWLATIGSTVFQYFVVLAIVLLVISPHDSLASERFVKILQVVSLGMTGYGFAWYWFRDRIEGQGADIRNPIQEGQPVKRQGWVSQIEVHTLLNGLLITSLAVLAMGRFFLIPDQPGAWISSVGSLVGVISWAAFGVLAFCVWRDASTKSYSTETWVWLSGWMGLILVGLGSAVVDRYFDQVDGFVAWLPFRVVMIGMLLVGWIQTGMIRWFDRTEKDAGVDSAMVFTNAVPGSRKRRSWAMPVLLTGSVTLTFAVRGACFDPPSFWLYLGVIVLASMWATLLGWILRDGKLSLVSAATAVLGTSILWWNDPHGWFNNDQPDWFNLVLVVLCCLALSWSTYYLVKRKSRPLPRTFVLLPNIVLLTGTIWIFVASMLQCGTDSFGQGNASSLANPLGITALLAIVGLSIVSLWNDQARFRVFSFCLISISLAITLASVVAPTGGWRFVNVMLGVGLVIAGWGTVWLGRAKFFRVVEQLGALNLDSLELSMRRQLPIYSLVFGGLVLIAALIVIFQFELRPHRYLAAFVPFALAIGLGAQSNHSSRRWLQLLTLLLITIGVLLLAWADLSRAQMNELPMTQCLVRSLIVLAGSMFVYGTLVTRWVRPGDTWLRSLREMAAVTCGLAVACLVLVIASEASAFVENVGCGLPLGESITVAMLVAGMIMGLITISIRPENDPFALTLQGRMGYVYAAEFVGLALIAHLYFSIPWLFQLGIKDYWPYILMALCFGGVGVAHILEKRKLTVLGQPLFNSAAILPLVVAFAIFSFSSKTNRELVMLTVGMAYLMISYTRRSILSGTAAVVFGNLSLWMFFQRAEFSFMAHPQLWLIPPAISTLIASQLSRKALSAKQLAGLRYICITVIYVSSTMEVFISGVGENLWPPIILAMFSVAGIMSGIMFRVKSFLYFGSLFLLMAMITMVAHAHRRLDHVWPWWAFGIGLGIAILVMFGLFEKRKNEMKAITSQLKDWEA